MLNLSLKINPEGVKKWSLFFASGCFLIAFLVLLGWQQGIDSLKKPINGLAAMNPTTALCLLFLSLSIIILHVNKRRTYVAVYLMSGVCVVVGVSRLFNISIGAFQIDQLLFVDDVKNEVFNRMPSRMTQDGALSFLLGGIALLTIRSSRIKKQFFQWLAIAIATISWLTILAYLYQVPEFYGELPYLPMALHTAVAFLLFALASLTFYPEHGLAREIFSPHQGSAAGWFMFPVVFLMPVILGYFRLIGHWNNIFSTEFGVALLVVSITLVVSIVLFVSIQMLNARDAGQKKLQNDLEHLNKDLKDKHEEIHALNEELTASNEEMLASNEELTVLNEQLQAAYEKIREQSETILKQKDEQLNRVLDTSLDVIFSIDLTENREHYISRSVEKVFGKISDGMLADGEYWMNLTHEDDRHIRLDSQQQLAKTGSSESTYRIKNINNEYRWILHRARLVFDGKNKPVRYEGIISDITNQKTQEDAINQYRENLDVIFTNTVEEILLLDNEGRVVLFNKALENFLTKATGHKPEMGGFVWDTTAAERRDASKKLFERAVKGESIVVDAPINTLDGKVIHELRYEPVYIGGKVKYVTIISIDVTERKKRENLLLQSEANLRSIFENTQDAFMLLDSRYTILMFNSASKSIASGNIQVGINIFDVVEGKRMQVFRTYLDRAASGEIVKYDIRSGEHHQAVWYHVTISAVQSNNELVGYCITTNNYTAIKLAEITLAESEDRFRTLIENSEDIFVLTSPEGKLTYVNHGVEKITGYSQRELLEMEDTTALIHPEDFFTYEQFFMEATNNPGKNINTSFRSRHKNGNWQWMEGTAVNLTRQQNIQGIVMNFRDITQRKLAEVEKTNLVSQLVEQNNDLRQFSFIASHNLRGPVASLLGLFNLFKENDLPLEMQELVAMSRKAINHLDTVIRDLSRILEMRSQHLHAKEDVNIRDTIHTIEVAIQAQIESSQALITLDNSAVSSFNTIKSYFYSILYNLLSNSVKYRSGDRQLQINITTFKTSQAEGFTVEDNGIGIDLQRSRDRIFGLYQRFHLEAEGKGLGLYMVKAQVQLLNGKIEVRSTPEVGTVFTVSFPRQ